MNNLKRIFSLGLTGAMLAGLMTVGAGAANFSDDALIENTDAVNTMVALGVISGRDTGAFDPKGNVTRAEMAKMLCVAINGGVDPTLGANTKPAYTDIAGHWAAKYIEYCTAMGYVSGRGDGTFDPNANVTSTEAAKMILTALGYKADVSGFMGIDWAINTNAQANQSGLYEKLGGLNTNAPLSRDNAAQMLYNSLDSKIVEESNGAYKFLTYTRQDYIVVTGTDGSEIRVPQSVNADETFGHKYLTVTTYNKDGVYLESVDEDSKGTYTVELSDGMVFTKVEKDFSSLMGEKVKVLYKDTDDVYGVYASGGAVLATGVIADIEVKSDKIEIDGKSFKTDAATVGDTLIYEFNNFDVSQKVSATLPANSAATIKVVDLDDDGKIDHIVYTPFTVGKVTYVGSKSATIGGTTVKFEDANVYEGVAKNDYAMRIDGDNTVSGDDTYTKVSTIISGDVTATRDSGEKFRVDGNWYTLINGSLQVSGSAASVAAGATLKKAVVVNGYAFYVDASKSVETKDYAVITKASGAVGMNGNQVELLFTDGTKKIVDTDADYSSSTPTIGDLVTYEIDDDEYTLTAAETSDADIAGFDSIISGTYNYEKNGKSTINGKYIDADAIVFVKDGTKYKVITGAQLARMGSATVTNAYANEDSATGYETIALAYVSGDVKSGDEKYGFVTTKINTVKVDGDMVAEFSMFTGTDTVDVQTSNLASSLSTLACNTIIKYVDDGDQIDVKQVYVLDETNTYIGAVTAYNGSDEFSFMKGATTETISGDSVNVINKSGTELNRIEIDKDTVILCVDLDAHEGVIGGEIELANKTPGENYYANVMVLGASADKDTADLIVYCSDILGAL